jgi:hypothetical protein
MSLVSTLVALGLLGFVSIALFKIIDTSNKGTSGVRNRSTELETRMWFSMLSHKGDLCQDAFVDASNAPIRYTDSSVSFNKVVAGTQELVRNSKVENIQITGMRIEPFFGGGSGTASEDRHPVAIVIDSQPVTQGFGAKSFSSRIPLILHTDDVGNIMKCSPVGVTEVASLSCDTVGPNKYISGFRADGSLDCRDLPTVPPLPPGTESGPVAVCSAATFNHMITGQGNNCSGGVINKPAACHSICAARPNCRGGSYVNNSCTTAPNRPGVRVSCSCF